LRMRSRNASMLLDRRRLTDRGSFIPIAALRRPLETELLDAAEKIGVESERSEWH
jgi:hypothetical protein